MSDLGNSTVRISRTSKKTTARSKPRNDELDKDEEHDELDEDEFLINNNTHLYESDIEIANSHVHTEPLDSSRLNRKAKTKQNYTHDDDADDDDISDD